MATSLLEDAAAVSEEDTADLLVMLLGKELLDVVSTLGVPETTKNLVKEADRARFYQMIFREEFAKASPWQDVWRHMWCR